ncbi:phage tail tape measure C-terminal domain-containing protein [Geomonas agri]|uniref:phage tail tape measure C-terminal domain-containing protein n=1 Tax=Geomonas agri TaxID=2873702 RepID=UPI001CD4D5FE|nr:phage tail tape measure C-terminal domain-containing protein [Geomonas agri]
MPGQLGELVVSISADMARFREDMGKSNRITQDTVKKMQADVSGGMKVVEGLFKSAATAAATTMAVLAGGAMFKGMIDTTKEVAGEVTKLSKVFGVTASQASVLRVALDDAFLTVDDAVGASDRLTRQALKNGDAFTKAGIDIKDSNGNLKDSMSVMMEVNDYLKRLKEGKDRDTAAMALYGKGWRELSGILRLTSEGMKEAEDRAKELHLVFGEDKVAAVKKYRQAMKDIDDVAESLKVQIGTALVPPLTRLAVAFGDIAVQGIPNFISALNSTEAEITRMAMLADKAGGSVTRLAWAVTGGNFTDTGKWWAEQNKIFEQRYLESDRALQTLANSEVGLDADGNRIKSTKPSMGSRVDLDTLAKAEKEKVNYTVNDPGFMNWRREQESLKEEAEWLQKLNKETDELEKKRTEATEALVKDWGIMKGTLDVPFGMPEKKSPYSLLGDSAGALIPSGKYSLTGPSETRMLGGPLIVDRAKEARELEAVTIAQINNQLALVDTAEKFYQISTGEAATKRIDLLGQELAAQQSIYDSIQGDGAEAVMARLQEQAVINGINEKLLEQKKILQSTTALGGMTVSLQEYAKAASNVGAQLNNATTNVMNNMEDALVSFTTSGKANFKSFADAVIKDLARIAVQQGLMGPLSSLASVGLGALGSIFGGSSTVPAQNGYKPMDMKSAAGGYDIPAGVNPIVQTHAKEMILPAEYAEVIRGMAKQPAPEPSQTSISVPVTVEGNNKLSSALRDAIEETVLQVMRRHA